MTAGQVRGILRKVRYKPGWRFSAQKLHPGEIHILAECQCRNSYRKRPRHVWVWRTDDVPMTATVWGVLRCVYRLIQWIERHERGEFFKHEGRRVFDPH